MPLDFIENHKKTVEKQKIKIAHIFDTRSSNPSSGESSDTESHLPTAMLITGKKNLCKLESPY